MQFEQFYLGCLAHASYMLVSEGEAVIVDPQRDVEIYLDAAAKSGASIRHIFETHLHADFVSGHRELAARTGATIYIGARANAVFAHTDVHDGFELEAGKVRIAVLETPGHTPESICLVITDHEKSPEPWAVLTGDTLFLGDVGRPDLSKTHTPAELAADLFDSLHNKILKLADDVLVYPAHGAGSLCGRNMRAERSSEDVAGYLDGGIDAWKRAGFPTVDLLQISVQTLNEWRHTLDVCVLDVRREPEWQEGHLENVMWIPLDRLAATPPPIDHNALIAVHCKGGYRSMIACSLLQRAGFRNVVNVIGGFDAWQRENLPVKAEPLVAERVS